MSKKKASEETGAEANEVNDFDDEEDEVFACVDTETVCDFITKHFIDLEKPRDGDKKLCETEFDDMAYSIECFIDHWVDKGEGLTISEARGVLYAIAVQYKNCTFPGVYECHSLAILLARFILDCIDDDVTSSMILNSPLEDRSEK